MQPKSLNDIGLTCLDFAISGALALEHYHALTLSREGFRANRTASQGSALDLPTSAIFGLNSIGSFATFDPVMSWLKTCQGYAQVMMDGILGEFYPTWPAQGMVLNGSAFQLQPLVLGTSENVYGLLPTPTASDTTDRSPGNPVLTANGTIRHQNKAGGQSFMRLSQVVKLLPTATVHGNYNRKGMSKTSGNGLATAILQSEGTTGLLNPQWVDWFMGFPVDHTACDA